MKEFDLEAVIAEDVERYTADIYEERDYSVAARSAIDRARRSRSRFVALIVVALSTALTTLAVAVALPLRFESVFAPGQGLTAPTSTIAELFARIDNCNTVIGGHEVSIPYPADWWAFPGNDEAPPCIWIAPDALSVPDPLTESPAGVVVTVGAVGGGPESEGNVLSSESLTIDGRDAIRVEEMISTSTGAARSLSYWIPLAVDGHGPTLIATTHESPRSDYQFHKEILTEIALGIDIRD